MTWSCAGVIVCAAIASGSIESTRGAQESRPSAAAPSNRAHDDRATPSALEAEVVANIKERAIGTAKVADLDLPDEYLHRVAGRILRASFEENFRVVVRDTESSDASTADARGMRETATEVGESSSSAPAASRSEPAATAGDQRSTPIWLVCSAGAALAALILVGARRAMRREARAR